MWMVKIDWFGMRWVMPEAWIERWKVAPFFPRRIRAVNDNLRIAIIIAAASWPMIGQCGDAWPTLEGKDVRSSFAKYHRHHHRKVYRAKRVDTSRRSNVLFASSPAVDTVASVFDRRQEHVRYPFTTGTSVLDDFEGRRPLSSKTCSDPLLDLQYVLAVDGLARY